MPKRADKPSFPVNNPTVIYLPPVVYGPSQEPFPAHLARKVCEERAHGGGLLIVHHTPEQFLESDELTWVEFFGHGQLHSIKSTWAREYVTNLKKGRLPSTERDPATHSPTRHALVWHRWPPTW